MLSRFTSSAIRSGVRFQTTATNEVAGAVKGAALATRVTWGQAAGAAKVAANVDSAASSAKNIVSPMVVGRPVVRRPIGSVRGGLLGFLLGFGIASAYGYTYLLKEYNSASNLMLASVEELQTSIEKVSTHLQRLNKLEADLKALSNTSATRSDADKNNREMKKIVDGLHDEVLEIRKRVIDLPRPTRYMKD